MMEKPAFLTHKLFRASKKYSLNVIVFVVLTLLTQVGGLVYLLVLLTSSLLKQSGVGQKLLLFLLLYSVVSFAFVPVIARALGREPIVNTDRISPTNKLTILLNRNYVVPRLNETLAGISSALEKDDPRIKVKYLDGSFPFINKFPLLPHLSHNDGKKIDLSFVYENSQGEISNSKLSWSGYGIFEPALEDEVNTTLWCKQQGYFQYDYPKYFSFTLTDKPLFFSDEGTRFLFKAVLAQPQVSKVFFEPHLVKRLGFSDPRIRFQGCRSVRHDDHIHLQIK